MRKRTIDESTARRLAVQADCDPRTVRKVLEKGIATSMSAKRAARALIEAGLLQATKAA